MLKVFVCALIFLGFSRGALAEGDQAPATSPDAAAPSAGDSKYRLQSMYGGVHYQNLMGPEVSWGYMLQRQPYWEGRGLVFAGELGVGGVKASLGYGAFVPFYPMAAGLMAKLIVIQGWSKDSIVAGDGSLLYYGVEIQATMFFPTLRLGWVRGAHGTMATTGFGIGF